MGRIAAMHRSRLVSLQVVTHKPGCLGRCFPMREMSDTVQHDASVGVEEAVESF